MGTTKSNGDERLSTSENSRWYSFFSSDFSTFPISTQLFAW